MSVEELFALQSPLTLQLASQNRSKAANAHQAKGSIGADDEEMNKGNITQKDEDETRQDIDNFFGELKYSHYTPL